MALAWKLYDFERVMTDDSVLTVLSGLLLLNGTLMVVSIWFELPASQDRGVGHRSWDVEIHGEHTTKITEDCWDRRRVKVGKEEVDSNQCTPNGTSQCCVQIKEKDKLKGSVTPSRAFQFGVVLVELA
ncbi:hypothetical protein PM082_012217 [Marasmius tenuissimus]|nr:hypothetical protein PM082_012217 [Marasmius tenuissimus]